MQALAVEFDHVGKEPLTSLLTSHGYKVLQLLTLKSIYNRNNRRWSSIIRLLGPKFSESQPIRKCPIDCHR